MRERTVHLNLRVTESEKKTIVRNARRCGLSVSEFLRKLAAGYVPKTVPPEEYRQLNQMLLTWYTAFRERGQMVDAATLAGAIRGLEERLFLMRRPLPPCDWNPRCCAVSSSPAAAFLKRTVCGIRTVAFTSFAPWSTLRNFWVASAARQFWFSTS